MNTEMQPNNRLFIDMLIAVMLIVTTIIYSVYHLFVIHQLQPQDNIIISLMAIPGIYLFAKSAKKDKYRLDKL